MLQWWSPRDRAAALRSFRSFPRRGDGLASVKDTQYSVLLEQVARDVVGLDGRRNMICPKSSASIAHLVGVALAVPRLEGGLEVQCVVVVFLLLLLLDT